MHIVIPVLALVVTILILLNRLANAGISLGGLNPFLWRRRRAWRQKIEADPLFSLHEPKEVAAVLAVGVAKIDGDMSAEEKRAVLKEFEDTFKLRPREAAELLGSSAYLLRDPQVLLRQLDAVIARGKDHFSYTQATQMIDMLERIANTAGAPSEHQRHLLDEVRSRFQMQRPQGTWN